MKLRFARSECTGSLNWATS